MISSMSSANGNGRREQAGFQVAEWEVKMALVAVTACVNAWRATAPSLGGGATGKSYYAS